MEHNFSEEREKNTVDMRVSVSSTDVFSKLRVDSFIDRVAPSKEKHY